MKKLKNWLVTLATLVVVVTNAHAQAVPHTTMDHRWQEGWYHETSPYTDREGNAWTVVAKSYTRVSEMLYTHLSPPSWVVTMSATKDGSGNWTYSTTSTQPGSEPSSESFYWEPEYYIRECYAEDEEGENIMGSKVMTTTEFEFVNTITRQPVNGKHRSTDFNGKVYWQWIPVDTGCGDEGALVTQLSGHTYTRNGTKAVNTPNQQARIVTFIGGRFPEAP